MKNIYRNIAKKLSLVAKSLRKLSLKWLNALKKDFTFYNKNTELLAIWTVLFMIITGLFSIGLKSKIPVILLLLALSFIVTFAAIILTTYYLYAIKYHKKKQLLPKTHNILNKSFKLRSLLAYVKLPYKLKNFRHLTKWNLKFTS